MKEILFIDDDVELCELLSFSFQGDVLNVTAVSDIAKLEPVLSQGTRFSAILIDLSFSQKDLSAILELVKHSKSCNPSRVALMSARHDIKQVAESLGVQRVFQKPFDVDDLEAFFFEADHD